MAKETTASSIITVENDKNRKYFYIEDGVVINTKFFKIENGLEIPVQEPEAKISLEIPPVGREEEGGNIRSIQTGEIIGTLGIGHQPKNDQGERYFKVYNETKGIGERHKIINNVSVETRFYKKENEQEVFCPRPENDKRSHTLLFNEEIFKEGKKCEAEIYNPEGQLLKTLPWQPFINVDGQTDIHLNDAGTSDINKIVQKILRMSEEEKGRLKTSIEKRDDILTLEGKRSITTTHSELEKALATILSSSKDLLAEPFYKSINPEDEFGISRIIADQFRLLPEMLKEPLLKQQENTTTYIISAKTNNSKNSGIRLEHSFQASSPEEAKKLARLIIKRLQGVQHKIWLAVWKMANEQGKFTYTCPLTEIMNTCYPERNAYFQTGEKVEFYENLKSLENTKIVITRKRKEKHSAKKKEKTVEDFIEIRALEIIKGTRDIGNKYPNSITISVLNTSLLQKEKMAFVGAGYKKKTLELQAKDSLLAQIIQTRKNQRQNAKELTFERGYLIRQAGLVKTDRANKTVANKRLIEKLKRIEAKDIILEIPQRIRSTVKLKIR